MKNKNISVLCVIGLILASCKSKDEGITINHVADIEHRFITKFKKNEKGEPVIDLVRFATRIEAGEFTAGEIKYWLSNNKPSLNLKKKYLLEGHRVRPEILQGLIYLMGKDPKWALRYHYIDCLGVEMLKFNGSNTTIDKSWIPKQQNIKTEYQLMGLLKSWKLNDSENMQTWVDLLEKTVTKSRIDLP